MREPVDALAAEPDGLLRPADLAVDIGKGAKASEAGSLARRSS